MTIIVPILSMPLAPLLGWLFGYKLGFTFGFLGFYQFRNQKSQSPCCNATIDAGLGDGVLIGSCSACGQSVCRVNPQTGKSEWLDGKSPWFRGELRLMETSWSENA